MPLVLDGQGDALLTGYGQVAGFAPPSFFLSFTVDIPYPTATTAIPHSGRQTNGGHFLPLLVSGSCFTPFLNHCLGWVEVN